MRMKRFLAASLQDAKEQIVRELGEDAVVLSSRQVKRRGILGWLGFSQVEVTAAIDTPLSSPKAVGEPTIRVREELHSDIKAAPWEDFQQDLTETRQLLESLSKRMSVTQRPSYPAVVDAYYSRLQKTGLDEEFTLELVEELFSSLSPEDYHKTEVVEQRGHDLLALRLRPHVFCADSKKQRVISLVGPTGVGKTTTIAKLAAHAVLQQKQRVALVTFDTYRIAAVDQLRTYGEILGAPVEVVLTPTEMRQTLDKLHEFDVIFVDSVGRSQQNMMQLSELKAFLEAMQADAVYLTISATTQYEVMLEIVQNYQIAKPTAFIFTKMDEAKSYGLIINLLCKTGLPIAFLANGQGVPDDLMQPSVEDLLCLLLREE
ncbi:MAG TPA: flagellar biosynthesis protein FlhF [Firmicutes bacterium]|nr:flagellar biosynthesis protein FlhF [Bacillota bacterium]